jgi:lactoylglutathione lyase
MHFAHTMIRISDVEKSLGFFCGLLGLVETRRTESEKGRFTLIFLAAPEQAALAKESRWPEIELTYNWDKEEYKIGRAFGHLAFRVDDIYAICEKLQKAGVTINRPPRDGRMAFVRSPDDISIELIQKGDALPLKEPWTSMPNTGWW